MNHQPKARILVVEDDQAILRGLLDVLVFNGFAAEGEADGADGLERARKGEYDLVLLDVMLPSLDGFSICRELRRAKPDQSIIMLTAKGAAEDVVTGLKAGADDYVSKPFSLQELLARVEAVLRRSKPGRVAAPLELGGLVFDPLTLTARSAAGRAAELTRREMDLIAYLHLHKRRVVPRQELLAEVWGYRDPSVETRTVDIHIQKLRKKLFALTGGSGLIATVRGEGYRLEELS